MSEGSGTQSKAVVGTLLSSKELLVHRKPSDKNLPKTGDKYNVPDGSWVHQERLGEYYRQRRSLLSEQRAEKIGNTVRGDWNPGKDLVELDKELGKFWSNMGFVDRERKWLFPEEALFLMETNVLETWYGGIPLSIQQAYSNFLSKSISYEEYQVYAHLRRLGFVVNRHRPNTSKNEGSNSDQQTSLRKRKILDENLDANKQVKVNDEVTSFEEETTRTTESDHQIMESEQSLPGSTSESFSVEESQIRSAQTVLKSPENMLPQPAKIENITSSTTHLVDFSGIKFPCVFGKKELELSDLSPELLSEPATCIVNLSNFSLNTASKRRKEKKEFATNTPTLPDTSALDFSFPDAMGKSRYEKIKARNWREYKQKKAEVEDQLSKMKISPCDVLWSGEVTPLVSPADAMSTASVLKKLNVIEEFDTPLIQRTEDKSIEFSFDAYQPSPKFKKSSPGDPHFRIYIQKHSAEPPTLSTIMETTSRLDDDVPILCAVIHSGTIALYNFSTISIPECVTMG